MFTAVGEPEDVQPKKEVDIDNDPPSRLYPSNDEYEEEKVQILTRKISSGKTND